MALPLPGHGGVAELGRVGVLGHGVSVSGFRLRGSSPGFVSGFVSVSVGGSSILIGMSRYGLRKGTAVRPPYRGGLHNRSQLYRGGDPS